MVIRKAKILEKKAYSASFTRLWGCRCDYKGGGVPKSNIRKIKSVVLSKSYDGICLRVLF